MRRMTEEDFLRAVEEAQRLGLIAAFWKRHAERLAETMQRTNPLYRSLEDRMTDGQPPKQLGA